LYRKFKVSSGLFPVAKFELYAGLLNVGLCQLRVKNDALTEILQSSGRVALQIPECSSPIEGKGPVLVTDAQLQRLLESLVSLIVSICCSPLDGIKSLPHPIVTRTLI